MGFFGAIGDFVGGIGNNTVNLATAGVKGVLNTTTNVVSAPISLFSGNISGAAQYMKDAGSNITDMVKESGSSIGGIWYSATSPITATFDGIHSAGHSIDGFFSSKSNTAPAPTVMTVAAPTLAETPVSMPSQVVVNQAIPVATNCIPQVLTTTMPTVSNIPATAYTLPITGYTMPNFISSPSWEMGNLTNSWSQLAQQRLNAMFANAYNNATLQSAIPSATAQVSTPEKTNVEVIDESTKQITDNDTDSTVDPTKLKEEIAPNVKPNLELIKSELAELKAELKKAKDGEHKPTTDAAINAMLERIEKQAIELKEKTTEKTKLMAELERIKKVNSEDYPIWAYNEVMKNTPDSEYTEDTEEVTDAPDSELAEDTEDVTDAPDSELAEDTEDVTDAPDSELAEDTEDVTDKNNLSPLAKKYQEWLNNNADNLVSEDENIVLNEDFNFGEGVYVDDKEDADTYKTAVENFTQARMELMDTDKDGTISEKEFINFELEIAKKIKDTQKRNEIVTNLTYDDYKAKERFAGTDYNGDGKIDSDELMADTVFMDYEHNKDCKYVVNSKIAPFHVFHRMSNPSNQKIMNNLYFKDHFGRDIK